MPAASGAGAKYAWMDHIPAFLGVDDPVTNQWYNVFNDLDVRLLWCYVYVETSDIAGIDVEVKWIIDGNEYVLVKTMADEEELWVYKDWFGDGLGAGGLEFKASVINAGGSVDKRGLDFMVDIRRTDANLQDDYINCYCVYETLEET